MTYLPYWDYPLFYYISYASIPASDALYSSLPHTAQGFTLPYLTLPYGECVLPPSANASSGPNVHPRINPWLLKPLGALSKPQEHAPMLLS